MAVLFNGLGTKPPYCSITMTDILVEHHILHLLELTDRTTASKIIALIGEIREALSDFVAASLAADVDRAEITHANFRLHDALAGLREQLEVLRND